MKIRGIASGSVRLPAVSRGGPAALLLPALLFLAVFALVPFLVLLVFSSLSLDLANPGSFYEFVGLVHYRALLQSDSSFNAAVIRTVQFTTVGVLFETVAGVLLAVILHGLPARVKSFVTSVAVVPMMMAPVAVGLMWLFLLQPDYGLVSHIISYFTDFRGALLADSRTALLVVRLVDIWEWTPFVTLVMLAGIAGIPRGVLDAARVDGLGPLERLKTIYWPALRGLILVALLLRLIEAVKVFDIVYILTGGGPGNATEMANIYLQRLAIRETKYGYAAAATVLMYYAVLLLTAVFFRLAMRRRESG
jgi:multiple sugar transport system permease protein